MLLGEAPFVPRIALAVFCCRLQWFACITSFCLAAPHLFGAGEQPSTIVCPASQHISCAAVTLPAMLSAAARALGGHFAQQALDVAVALIGDNESSGAHRLAQALQTEQATLTPD